MYCPLTREVMNWQSGASMGFVLMVLMLWSDDTIHDGVAQKHTHTPRRARQKTATARVVALTVVVYERALTLLYAFLLAACTRIDSLDTHSRRTMNAAKDYTHKNQKKYHTDKRTPKNATPTRSRRRRTTTAPAQRRAAARAREEGVFGGAGCRYDDGVPPQQQHQMRPTAVAAYQCGRNVCASELISLWAPV